MGTGKRLGRFSYTYEPVARGVNRYTISDNRTSFKLLVEEQPTDRQRAKIKEKVELYKYYLNEGNKISESVMDGYIDYYAKALKCDKHIFFARIVDSIRSGETNSDKVINVIKQATSAIPTPNGWDIAGWAVSLANMHNAEYMFNELKKLA